MILTGVFSFICTSLFVVSSVSAPQLKQGISDPTYADSQSTNTQSRLSSLEYSAKLSQLPSVGLKQFQKTIRVRLKSFLSSPRITGRFFKVGELNKEQLTMQTSQQIQLKRGQLIWPSSAEGVVSMQAHQLSFKGKDLTVNGHRAPDHFVIHADEKKLNWIGFFDLENYIKGVLVKEMPASYPLEALKAQAIAARTYALKRMSLRKDQAYDLESTVQDQAFQWPPQAIPQWAKDKIDRAVNETKGLVLKSKRRGQLIHAFYHADCGGSTETAFEVWQMGRPSTSRKLDRSCRIRSSSRWRTSLSESQIVSALRKHYFVPPFQSRDSADRNLVRIEVSGTSPSGRVKQLKFVFWNGHQISMSGEGFRKIFGYNKVKSTLMGVNYNLGLGVLSLSGRGHGHGVGLCQKGSRVLAGADKSVEEILGHYYPFAEVREFQGDLGKLYVKSHFAPSGAH